MVPYNHSTTELPPGGRPDHTDIDRDSFHHCTLTTGGGVASATARKPRCCLRVLCRPPGATNAVLDEQHSAESTVGQQQ